MPHVRAGGAGRALSPVGDGEPRVVVDGVEVLVPEQFLHEPEVRAATDQIGRARAAQRVRCHRHRQVEAVGVLVHPAQEDGVGDARAVAVDPERTLGRVLHRERPHAAQVTFKQAQHDPTDGHGALLVALAGDDGRRVVQVEVGDVQPAQLGRPDSRRVERIQHRAIAEAGRVRRVDLRREFCHLRMWEDSGRKQLWLVHGNERVSQSDRHDTAQLLHYTLEPDPELPLGDSPSSRERLVFAFSTADVVVFGARLTFLVYLLLDHKLTAF